MLAHLAAERMVVGHTPQSRINTALSGRVWRVDVGASKGVMNGIPEVLEIVKDGTEEIVSVLTQSGKVPASERQASNAHAATFL